MGKKNRDRFSEWTTTVRTSAGAVGQSADNLLEPPYFTRSKCKKCWLREVKR